VARSTGRCSLLHCPHLQVNATLSGSLDGNLAHQRHVRPRIHQHVHRQLATADSEHAERVGLRGAYRTPCCFAARHVTRLCGDHVNLPRAIGCRARLPCRGRCLLRLGCPRWGPIGLALLGAAHHAPILRHTFERRPRPLMPVLPAPPRHALGVPRAPPAHLRAACPCPTPAPMPAPPGRLQARTCPPAPGPPSPAPPSATRLPAGPTWQRATAPPPRCSAAIRRWRGMGESRLPAHGAISRFRAAMALIPPPPDAPYAFVTVGTTQFDPLVSAVFSDDFARAVRDVWGLRCVVVQLGRGAAPEAAVGPRDAAGPWEFVLAGDVRFVAFRLRPTLADLIAHATVVISHAGAGSVFETVRARRPLCVVVNTALADNHQVELAVAMQELGHAVHTVPLELCTTLRAHADSMRLHASRPPLPPPDGAAFTAAVLSTMGGSSASPGSSGCAAM